MGIPNYDTSDAENNYKQLYPFMPSDTFRMLICGSTGCGKANLLYHILMKPLFFFLIYYDDIYARNLEQNKTKN